MTLLDEVIVSRKTPLDGKLEVSSTAAEQLRRLAGILTVRVGQNTDSVLLESMECTCAKAASGRHVHHFIVSPVLRALSSGASVVVLLDEPNRTLDVSTRQV
jgi:hypothetical protein